MTDDNKRTMREIVAAKLEAAEMLEQLGGEVAPQFEVFLAGLEHDFKQKSDGYTHMVHALEEQANYFASLANDFKKKSKAIESAADRLRDRIKETMAALGAKRIDGDLYSWVLSDLKPKLVIDDDEQIPEFYKDYVDEPTWTTNKDNVRKALEQGEEIPGASLQPVKALRAVVNTRSIKGK